MNENFFHATLLAMLLALIVVLAHPHAGSVVAKARPASHHAHVILFGPELEARSGAMSMS